MTRTRCVPWLLSICIELIDGIRRRCNRYKVLAASYDGVGTRESNSLGVVEFEAAEVGVVLGKQPALKPTTTDGDENLYSKVTHSHKTQATNNSSNQPILDHQLTMDDPIDPISGLISPILPGGTVGNESQISYCDQCQKMLESLFGIGDHRAWQVKLDITSIISEKKCCFCALIRSKCKLLEALTCRYLTVQNAWKFLRFTSEDNFIHAQLEHTHLIDLAPGEHPYNHYVSASTDSPQCWALVKRWLSTCKTQHACGHASLKLPTRLIKVSSGLYHLHCRLVETKGFSGPVIYCSA